MSTVTFVYLDLIVEIEQFFIDSYRLERVYIKGDYRNFTFMGSSIRDVLGLF
jgi:hypothetical protein